MSSGAYRDRSELLDAAVEILRQNDRFVQEVDEAIDQLDRGEGTVYTEDEFVELVENVKRRGRERLSQNRHAE